MDAIGDEAIQDVFGSKHIVVPDQFIPYMDFDEKGLGTLAELNKPVTVHGPCFRMIFYCPSC
jgi:hypothetical protein